MATLLAGSPVAAQLQENRERLCCRSAGKQVPRASHSSGGHARCWSRELQAQLRAAASSKFDTAKAPQGGPSAAGMPQLRLRRKSRGGGATAPARRTPSPACAATAAAEGRRGPAAARRFECLHSGGDAGSQQGGLGGSGDTRRGPATGYGWRHSMPCQVASADPAAGAEGRHSWTLGMLQRWCCRRRRRAAPSAAQRARRTQREEPDVPQLAEAPLARGALQGHTAGGPTGRPVSKVGRRRTPGRRLVRPMPSCLPSAHSRALLATLAGSAARSLSKQPARWPTSRPHEWPM